LWSLIDDPSLEAAHLESLKSLASALQAMAEPALADPKCRPIFLRCGSILVETAEVFGHPALAHAVLEAGPAIYHHVQRSSSGAVQGPSATREEIRFAVNFAFSAVYREGEAEGALSIIDRCIHVLEGQVTKDLPCFATRGHAHFHRALVERQLGRDDRALADLHLALEFFAAKSRLDRPQSVADSRPYPRWLVQRAVDVLIEMGFAAYSQGSLSRALDCASAAELVQHSGTNVPADVITTAYTTLLRSAVKRSAIGRSHPDELKQLLADLREVEASYARFGHVRGQMRARYEQAQTFLYLVEEAEARRCLESVRELAAANPDQRWACYADSQLCKIAPTLDEALTLSTRALERGERFRLRMCQIDARLARADAVLKFRAEPALARTDLHRVLDYDVVRTGSSPRLRARCLLLMARSYLREPDATQADAPLGEARKLIESVEHEGLRQLLGQVEAERDNLDVDRDFRIRPRDSHNYKQHARQLRRWLLSGAERKHSSDRAVSTALGISRMTLYKWRKSLGKATGGRRRAKRSD
jgi:tetratricopeptide (TPR) repeat protein